MSTAQHTTAQLTLLSPDGRRREFTVEGDAAMIVGSAESCSIRIDGSDVAAMHCTFDISDGRLQVRDWYTESGTRLNGLRIQEMSYLQPGDEVTVGSSRLIVGGDAIPTATPRVAEPTGQPSSPVPDESLAQAEAAWATERYDLEERLETAQRRIAHLTAELANVESFGDAPFVDPFDAEMLELLQTEVAHLQDEVKQRDARIAELSEFAGDAPVANEDSPEVEGLVSRLEELLDELQVGDRRVADLEELLRCADDAAQAEQEERRQIERWLEEIEQRVGAKEAEWQAECEVLQSRIADGERQRRRLLERFSGQSDDDSRGVIAELRSEVDSLRERLTVAETGAARLNVQSAAAADSSRDGDLKHEQLQLAEERANLTRERSELARLRSELESHLNSPAAGREADEKIHAFRQHLREIHARDERQEEERPGLAARIARLWKRL